MTLAPNMAELASVRDTALLQLSMRRAELALRMIVGVVGV